MIQQYTQTLLQATTQVMITSYEGKILTDQDTYTYLVEALQHVRARNGNLYLIGNGGSSGIVSHAATDLLNKGHFKAQAITDNSLLTCLANDYGFENVFLTLLQKTATKEDALIGVSSSGKSPNIVHAARFAKETGMFVLTFSGFTADNPLRTTGNVNFWVNSRNYGIVEISHSILLHILTDALWVE